MSRQGTVWTPPRPSGTETTQKEREFQEAARPPSFNPILSVQGCGQGGHASRDQTPTRGSRAAGTEHRHKEPLAPGARAGGARSPGQQGSHLLGPHTRCEGFTRTGAGAAVGGRGAETPQQGCSRPSPGNTACTRVMSPAQHRDQGALAGARPRQQRWCPRGQRRSVGPPGLCGT